MQFVKESDFNKKIPDVTKELVMSENVELNWHLKELMNERDIKGAELAEITGIQTHTISKYANNKQNFGTINSVHVIALMIALRLTDMSELVTITTGADITTRFKREADEWKDSKIMPRTLQKILKHNKNRSQ